ncbi:MAG TPA: pentapeptide repeat-containing protein [Acidimicrobiales bacterium]
MPQQSPGLRARLRSPVALGAAVTAATVLVIVLVIWALPALLTRRPVVTGSDRHAAIASARTALITMLAAFGALGGLAYTARTYRLSRLGNLTGRFQTASTQMGVEDTTVRLGGIQAMAQLADEWPQQRQRCIDLLCAYVRNAVDADDDEKKAGKHRDTRRRAIELIQQRLTPSPRAPSWIGCNFDFRDAVIDVGDFSGVCLSAGRYYFDNATFKGDAVTFADATFGGAAVTFNGAIFEAGASVTFEGARFVGGRVSFYKAAFDGQVSFSAAWFGASAVTFTEAYLGGGTVSFDKATFAGGKGPRLSFERALFLGGGGVTFARAVFLTGVSFDHAEFGVDVSFEEADLSRGWLSFRQATFAERSLTFDGARCSGATLYVDRATDVGDSDLGIDLRGAVDRPDVVALTDDPSPGRHDA